MEKIFVVWYILLDYMLLHSSTKMLKLYKFKTTYSTDISYGNSLTKKAE
jgi:hypothetical protein